MYLYAYIFRDTKIVMSVLVCIHTCTCVHTHICCSQLLWPYPPLCTRTPECTHQTSAACICILSLRGHFATWEAAQKGTQSTPPLEQTGGGANMTHLSHCWAGRKFWGMPSFGFPSLPAGVNSGQAQWSTLGHIRSSSCLPLLISSLLSSAGILHLPRDSLHSNLCCRVCFWGNPELDM